MTIFQTVVLGIVEGLTEFLPISSTGHMIIVQKILGLESSDFVKMFTVSIQLGAILSVLVLYWKRFIQNWNFYYKLFVAVIPALVLGYFLGNYIHTLLGSVVVVASSLLLGGIVLLFVDNWFTVKPENEKPLTYRSALVIGFCQCIAMIPGISRAAASIVGGMSQKLTRKTAAEFSFFLAVPTMFAATAFELKKSYVANPDIIFQNMDKLLIGNVIAFIVAMAAIKLFIAFLTKHGFKLFGYYRIILGLIILILVALRINLTIFS